MFFTTAASSTGVSATSNTICKFSAVYWGRGEGGGGRGEGGGGRGRGGEGERGGGGEGGRGRGNK